MSGILGPLATAAAAASPYVDLAAYMERVPPLTSTSANPVDAWIAERRDFLQVEVISDGSFRAWLENLIRQDLLELLRFELDHDRRALARARRERGQAARRRRNKLRRGIKGLMWSKRYLERLPRSNP